MISGIKLTDLSIVPGENGNVFHFMKKSDPCFVDFGEVYFSSIDRGAIRAWKLHTKMTLNVVIPQGKVLFNMKDLREGSPTFGKLQSVMLSQEPWQRLTVPPGIWFGFKGLGLSGNLVCNQADLSHDPREVMKRPLNEIGADWSLE